MGGGRQTETLRMPYHLYACPPAQGTARPQTQLVTKPPSIDEECHSGVCHSSLSPASPAASLRRALSLTQAAQLNRKTRKHLGEKLKLMVPHKPEVLTQTRDSLQ